MELRRKEHAVRQVSKQMSYMENEKNALVDRLNDAEKTMTAAARYVWLFLTSVIGSKFGQIFFNARQVSDSRESSF